MPSRTPSTPAALALTVAAALLTVFLVHPADRVTPDGAVYLDAAASLAEGLGFLRSDLPADAEAREPISVFAPGFSWLMALPMRLGAEALSSARWVLGLSLLGLVLGCFFLSIRVAGRPGTAALIAAAVGLSPTTLYAAENVLSDLPFAALAAFALLHAVRLVGLEDDQPVGARPWVLLGVLAGLGVLLRWAGMFWAAALFAALLLAPGGRRRLRGVATAGLTTVAVAAPWLIRNLYLTGTLFGGRSVRGGSAASVLPDALNGISRLLRPVNPEGWIAIVILSVTAVIWLVVAGSALRRARGGGREASPVSVVLLTGSGYALLMVLAAVLHPFDPLSRGRFWLPLLPVAAVLLASGLAASSPRPARAASAVAVLLILVGGVGFVSGRSLPRDAGLGWQHAGWVESETAALLQEELPCRVMSNEARLAVLLGGRRVVHRLPTEAEELGRELNGEEPTCVVLFTEGLSTSRSDRLKSQRGMLRAAAQSGPLSLQRRTDRAELWLSPANLLLPDSDAPPLVLLFVIDTLRADRLSAWDPSAGPTPNLDRLASMGVRFADAHSPSPWTRPSMGAIFTSRYPSELGLVEAPEPAPLEPRQKRKQRSNSIPDSTPTIAEALRAAGYRTAAFIDQPALHISQSYRRGFEDVFYPAEPGVIGKIKSGKQKQSWSDISHAYENDLALVDRLDRWLAQHGDGPAFVWLHLLTPHRPYNPPEQDRPELPEGLDRAQRDSLLYDAEVRATDRIVGRLLEILDERAPGERLIIFTSDHGEEFGEHGELEHGHSLHREVVHVPLVVAGAGVPAGRTVTQRVRTIDIAPTLRELLGLEPDGDAVGRSLTPMFDGAGRSRDVYSEAMLYGPTERSLAVDERRIIWDEQTGAVRLYDLSADRAETDDLAPAQAEAAEELRRAMEFVRRKAEQRRGAGSEDVAGNPALDQALRSLGYGVDDSDEH